MGKEIQPNYHFDPRAAERFRFVVETGQRFFSDSALVDPAKLITNSDLKLIDIFDTVVAPTNPKHPWRLQGADTEEKDTVNLTLQLLAIGMLPVDQRSLID